jgi:hypothetical protein
MTHVSDTKNTLKTPQSTQPFNQRFPFQKPTRTNTPKFSMAFRTQNRGGK